MLKILVWYVDTRGDTRVEMLEKPDGYEVQTLLYEFSRKDAVRCIVEAYTVAEIHHIVERTWTEGFYVETVDVLDREHIAGIEERNRYERTSWEERRD